MQKPGLVLFESPRISLIASYARVGLGMLETAAKDREVGYDYNTWSLLEMGKGLKGADLAVVTRNKYCLVQRTWHMINRTVCIMSSYSVKHFSSGRSNLNYGWVSFGQTEHNDGETRSKPCAGTQAERRKNLGIFSPRGRSLVTA